MRTFGLRHVAIQVSDPQRCKEFYLRVLRMELEWEPDPGNIYLTSGGLDNLAIHGTEGLVEPAPGAPQGAVQRLDHIGFALPTLEDVDLWYDWVRSQNATILREIKTHRDGARSFYLADPRGPSSR